MFIHIRFPSIIPVTLLSRIQINAQPAQVDLVFEISTPSLTEAGRVFNSEAFPDVPYQASGELQRNGSRMTVKLASENLQLQLSGNIGDEMDRGTDTSGLQLDLNTETINMAFSTRSRQGVGISAGKAVIPFTQARHQA